MMKQIYSLFYGGTIIHFENSLNKIHKIEKKINIL